MPNTIETFFEVDKERGTVAYYVANTSLKLL